MIGNCATVDAMGYMHPIDDDLIDVKRYTVFTRIKGNFVC